jgi:hypothetical protein
MQVIYLEIDNYLQVFKKKNCMKNTFFKQILSNYKNYFIH